MSEEHHDHEEFQHRYVAVVATTIGAVVVTLGLIGILLNLG